MAILKDGISSDLLTIDPTSKAARASQYDARGGYRGPKSTYRGSGITSGWVAAVSTGAFFAMTGSASRLVAVQRLNVTAPVLTAIEYLPSILIQKWIGLPSGGTTVTINAIALDSASPDPTLQLLTGYTAAPTPPNRVIGAVGVIRNLKQSSTAAAGALPMPYIWDFRNQQDSPSPIYLRGQETIMLSFPNTPGSAVTLTVEVEWTEQ